MATIDEINKLKEKLAELEREFADATGEREKELELMISLLEKQIDQMEKQTEHLNKQLAVEQELVKQGKSREELLRLQILANNRLIESMKQTAIESGVVDANLQKQLEKLQEANEYLEAERELILEINGAFDQQAKSAMKVAASLKNLGKNADSFLSILKQADIAGQELSKTLDPTGFISGVIEKQIDAVKDLVLGFDEQTKAFERQFAVGEKYTKQIEETYFELNELGASIEDVTKATGDLITNFTDFTLISDAQQKSLERTSTLLERNFGITEEFSKGMQTATKAMGMTVPEAENLNLELVAVADALDLAPQAALATFESLTPQLAKFGSEIGKNFKETMRLSKLTGMEIGKILNIAAGFDTFEEAAERTGMLNAALGGNFVNAMDMMMETDPNARFMMISDAINQTGLSFQDMGYYQRQFFTEAAGLDDVNDLALLMSGRFDLLAGSTQASAETIAEQRERAASLMTMMESLKAIFVENSEEIIKATGSLTDLIATMNRFISFLSKFGPVLKFAAAFAGIVKFTKFLAGPFIGAFKLVSAFRARAAAKEIASNKMIIGQNVKLIALQKQRLPGAGKGFGVMRPPTPTAGPAPAPGPKGPINPAAGKTAATGIAAMKPGAIMALAVPLLALGVGLGAAAYGFSFLAKSMAEMNVKQMAGLAVIVGGLSLLFFKFSVALMTIAPAAEFASLPLLKLGGAIALLGLGIGLAAAGIGVMAMGFSLLDGPQLLGVAGALIALSGGLALVFAIGVPAAPVLQMLALALVGMGVAALAVGAGIALAADSIKELSADQLYGLAAASVAFGAGLGALAFGASLLANPLAVKGLFILGAAGAGIALIAKGLGLFKKEKQVTKELAPTIGAFGGVTKGQFEAAEQAFSGMENSLRNMSAVKLLTLSGALKAVAAINPNVATATPAANQTVPASAAAAGRTNRNTRETIEVKLNFENPFTGKFESEVLDIVRDEVNSEVTYALQYGTSPI